MSDTYAAHQAAETQPTPEEPQGPRAPRSRRRRRARKAAVATATVVVLGGAAAGVVAANPFHKHHSPPPVSSNAYPTQLYTIKRGSLVSQTQQNATLGNGGSYTIVNQMTGTFTQLPGAGQVFHQGQVLYHVSGNPVLLLYGSVPAYRTLSDGMTGADVRELNAALVSLGYASSQQLDPHSDVFTLETAYALEQLQSHLDVLVTGELTLGQAVFLPGPLQISGVGAGTVLGGTAGPGGTVLTATSTTPVVTIALPVGDQGFIRVGDRVTINLPNNQPTPGIVSSVGKIATTAPGGTGSTGPTITVLVTPTNPKAVAGLTSAPVTVLITTASANNVLVVPVTSLLAQSSGGYAVEVAGAAGSHHLVPVTLGMFDDANGLVSVSGPGLVAGEQIVIPGT